MAYNRKNILQRMIDIQKIYRTHSKNYKYGKGGCTDKWIYNTLIFPTYRISRATFYDYLSTPAEKELENLLEAEKKQLTLFG